MIRKNSSDIKKSALDLVESEISQELINGEGTAKEMALAIQEITKVARNNIETRIGLEYRNSNHNLSYVITKNVTPILEKIIIPPAVKASELLQCLNKNSKPGDILCAENIIKSIYLMTENKDRAALDILRGSLIIIRAHFSPNEKSKRKVKLGKSDILEMLDDLPFCKFCYREARAKFDSCEVHAGTGRVDGKKYLARYLFLKKEILAIRKSTNISNEFVVAKLKSAGISKWEGNLQETDWTKKLLLNIRAYSSNCESVSELTKNLIDSSKSPSFAHPHNDWPSVLEGTLFRYEVYKLMEYRQPSKEVAHRLNQIWAGKNEVLVAKKSKIKVAPFKKRISLWATRVKLMRDEGVADSIIKLVLGLAFLPEINNNTSKKI